MSRCLYAPARTNDSSGQKLDVSASYPKGTIALNISKRTTVREMCYVVGIDEYEMRMQNMGLTAGYVNSLEYCTSMFNAPKPADVLKMFESEIN